MIKEAINILQHNKPDDHFIQTLIDASVQHPYAASLRVLLARASQLNEDARFEDHVREAAIRTHNRKQLHEFVYSPIPEKEVEAIKPIIAEIEEQEPIAEELSIDTACLQTIVEKAQEEESDTTEIKHAEVTTKEEVSPILEPAEEIVLEEAEANIEAEAQQTSDIMEESPQLVSEVKEKYDLDQARIEVLERQFLTEALAAGAAIELLGIDDEVQDNINFAQNIRQKNQKNEEESEKAAEETVETEKPIKPSAPEKLSFSGWLHLLEDEPEAISEEETVKEEISQPEVSTKSKTEPIIEKPAPTFVEKPAVIKGAKEVADIITNFIQNEDQIVPKRAEFFNPAKAAKNSLLDKDDLVTETLANIYAAQGNISKAISTYEKLSLLHPEKSTYFAALIQKLKRQL
ncbi:MAG: hypothetical protein NWR30_04480 [Salibacteraceae bacterium]|nr:hypothetical protein [Salibacteraceae bacterium]